MKNKRSDKQEILILNKVYTNRDNRFYFQLFRIPEVLNRLKQYREVLNEKGITIPIWVYSLIQDFKVLTEGHQPFTLNFLISLGLFDRYVSYKGWPKYIIGANPLISVIAGEVSFEEQVLLLNYGYNQSSSKMKLYETSSYYNTQLDSFYLNKIKELQTSPNIGGLLEFLNTHLKIAYGNQNFQLLAPHEAEFMAELKSKGFIVKDFLEFDSSLKWIWPSWKKLQLERLKSQSVQAGF